MIMSFVVEVRFYDPNLSEGQLRILEVSVFANLGLGLSCLNLLPQASPEAHARRPPSHFVRGSLL